MESETLELAEAVQAWHTHRVSQVNTVLDAPASTEVRLGDEDDAIILTGERLAGFRIGMAVALGMFDTLPFSLERNAEDEE